MDASKLGLGQIITTEQQRDAIHIAIAPVIAAHRLSPGMRVGLDSVGHATNLTEKDIGVIDPFLDGVVMRGERCWMFLFPGTITGLRHEWTHPAFEAAAPPELDEKAKSEAFLKDIASQCGVDYQHMMDCMDEDDYINMGENEGYKNVLPDGEVLATHFENVRGHKPKSTYVFSCSC